MILNSQDVTFMLNQLNSFDPVLIYQFGSQVEGRARADSDIDLAVLCNQPVSELENFELAQSLASKMGRDVDLVQLKTANTVLKVQVIKNGFVLYCKSPNIQQEFEMYALSDYARLNEERKPVLDRIAKEGSVYGN